MDDIKLKSPIIIFAIFVLSTALLIFTQSSQTKLILFPLLLLMVSVSWYIQKSLREAHTNHEKHKKNPNSFFTKLQLLRTDHILTVTIVNGLIIVIFTFFWSFFVSGLGTALANTGLSFLLYLFLLLYLLLSPKEFISLANSLPRKYRKYSRSPWIQSYLLLLPFLLLCFVTYSLTTVTTSISSLVLGIPNFFIFYTLFFISLYCFYFLYLEYHREEETMVKNFVKKLFE